MFVLNVKKNMEKGSLKILEPLKILRLEWRNLNLGIEKAKHNYHSFVFSTMRNDRPESRTVILRAFDENERTMWFHTDKRSNKILDIKRNGRISALFYDESRKVQLRIRGFANVEQDNKTKQKIWNSMTPESRLCYMGPYAPSQSISHFVPNTLEKSAQEINEEDNKLGLSRFCRIRIKIKKLDWLQLDHKGHKRLEYDFGKTIKTKWIAS